MSQRNQGIISGIEGTVTIHSDVDATTSAILLNNWTAIIAPAVTDDSALGYAVGSEWTDVTADKSYKLVDATVGAAVWKEITAAGGGGSSPWIASGSDIYYPTGSTVAGSSSIDGSAILQGNSTTKGFLPPRMTTGDMELIAAPAEGLMVFDTTTKQWMGHNGTSWVILG